MAKITVHGERDVARWRKVGEPSAYDGSRANQTLVLTEYAEKREFQPVSGQLLARDPREAMMRTVGDPRWLLGGFAFSILLWVLIGLAVWQFVVWL